MIRVRLFFAVFGVFSLVSSSFADKAIVLTPGQSYKTGDHTVICTDSRSTEPIAVTECQYWDDFNKKCLFESTRYVLPGVQCLESCQHWDSFFKRCNYATSCKYEPGQGVFLETSCAEYDDFNKKCLRERQKIIRRGNRGMNRHERR